MKEPDELEELISQGEHQRQDFKYEISSIRKIAKTVSAFANTDGGRLLVGVRDNGTIAGIRSDEEIYMIEAAAETECVPKVSCSMEVVSSSKGKSVLIATVSKADFPPVMCKDDDGKLRAYVRVGDETVVATAVHMYLWNKRNRSEGSLLSLTRDMENALRILDSDGVTLNRFCRKARMDRKRCITLLGDLIDFGLAEIRYKDQSFIFHSL